MRSMRMNPILLFAACAAFADVKLDISPRSAKLISAKDPRWDTVAVETYVYNGGDSTFVNAGGKGLLYLDLRIDTVSAAKHYLAPGDSLEPFTGKIVRDTFTVLKTPFALVAWADPLKSFGAEPAVENLRASSMYVDLHPKRDTVRVAGCPTAPRRKTALRPLRSVPTVVYDIAGRPIWSGKLPSGVPGKSDLPAGAYLMVQGPESRIFRILPR